MLNHVSRLTALAGLMALGLAVPLALQAEFIATNAATTAENYDAAVMADGPLGYWPLAEASGNVTADRTNGPAGVLEGAVSLGQVAGPVAGTTALRTAGGPCDGVNLDASADRIHPSAVTVEAWVQTDSPAGLGIVFRARHYGYNLLAGTDGLQMNGTGVTAAAGVSVADGRWHHLVGTEGPLGGALYFDGNLVTSNTEPVVLEYPDSYAAIGRDANACDGVVPSFTGNIADVAVYSGALSPDRVFAHYRAAAVQSSGLVLDAGTFIRVVAHADQPQGPADTCTTGFGAHDATGQQFALGAKHCASQRNDPNKNNANKDGKGLAILSPFRFRFFDPVAQKNGAVIAAKVECGKTSLPACRVPDPTSQTGDFFAWRPDTASVSARVQTGSSVTPRPVLTSERPESLIADKTVIYHYGAGVAAQGQAEVSGTLYSAAERKAMCKATTQCVDGLYYSQMNTVAGDSGGPVYEYSGGRTGPGVIAVGLVVQHIDYCVKKKCVVVTGFAAVDDALNRLGLTLNTSR